MPQNINEIMTVHLPKSSTNSAMMQAPKMQSNFIV